MGTGSWHFDTTKTQERYARLEAYYREKGLNADHFSCRYFAECSASQKDDTIKQYAGGTAGLMPFYDAEYDGVPVRVLVVGKESGYMSNSVYGTAENFTTNSNNLLKCVNWRRKNNHIKGTLITLQHVFAVHTEYIYVSYALSDALRCAFQSSDRADNLSAVLDTSVMRANCLGYLVDEIRILEPTLIIVQGEWAIKDSVPFVPRLARAFGVRERCLMTSNNGKYGLFEFPHFMLITSHHPAILGHWLANLAPDSLWPMLDHLRDIGFLPQVDADATTEYEAIVKPAVDPLLAALPSNDRLRHKDSAVAVQLDLF